MRWVVSALLFATKQDVLSMPSFLILALAFAFAVPVLSY